MGLIPVTPHADAGRRIEPPVSEPSDAYVTPDATAAPEPDDEPPVTYGAFHGLWQSPNARLWPVGFCANSAMLSPAKLYAPAAESRSTTVQVIAGTKSRRIADPHVQGRPAW